MAGAQHDSWTGAPGGSTGCAAWGSSGAVLAASPRPARTKGVIDIGALLRRVAISEGLQSASALASVQTTVLQPPNLITNGDFQQSNDGWGNYGTTDATTLVTTNWQYPGDVAIQVVNTGGFAGPEMTDIHVVPGAQMKLSFYFNVINITGATGRSTHPLYARIFRWDDRTYMTECGIGDVHVGQGWTYGEKAFSIPADVTRIGIGLYTRGTGLSASSGACPSADAQSPCSGTRSLWSTYPQPTASALARAIRMWNEPDWASPAAHSPTPHAALRH